MLYPSAGTRAQPLSRSQSRRHRTEDLIATAGPHPNAEARLLLDPNTEIDAKARHGAGKPIFKIIDETGDEWTFVAYTLKMDVQLVGTDTQ